MRYGGVESIKEGPPKRKLVSFDTAQELRDSLPKILDELYTDKDVVIKMNRKLYTKKKNNWQSVTVYNLVKEICRCIENEIKKYRGLKLYITTNRKKHIYIASSLKRLYECSNNDEISDYYTKIEVSSGNLKIRRKIKIRM